MKTIALIGANGQLACDILRVFNKRAWRIYPFFHKDIEIKDSKSVARCLSKRKVDIVINTAAYHNIDRCEENPHEAFAVNAVGVHNLSAWCQQHNSTLVHFSTDYVFGLSVLRRTPYQEENPVGPLNVYGTSKAAGESFVQAIVTKHFLIRTSGLFGITGSSVKGENFIDTIIHQAQKKQRMRIVSDQILSPTYTKNLAENLEVLLQTNQFGLYHMVSHGQCSWYELAKTVLSYMKLTTFIAPISTKMRTSTTPRPLYSALSTKKLHRLGIDRMNTWQDNVKLYLKEKGYLEL